MIGESGVVRLARYFQFPRDGTIQGVETHCASLLTDQGDDCGKPTERPNKPYLNFETDPVFEPTRVPRRYRSHDRLRICSSVFSQTVANPQSHRSSNGLGAAIPRGHGFANHSLWRRWPRGDRGGLRTLHRVRSGRCLSICKEHLQRRTGGAEFSCVVEWGQIFCGLECGRTRQDFV